MHSKTSKSFRSPRSPWKVEHDCSEHALALIAREFAREVKVGDRVLLEGPLGAGKTFFAKCILLALGVEQPPEGSPTFAIAHEYDLRAGRVVHIDFYRLKNQLEIEEAGVESYYWEREALVISEWLSLFPIFRKAVIESGRVWEITLNLESDGKTRGIEIRQLSSQGLSR